MTNYPLVSVLCLCYNQEKFVEQAIQSVKDQTYPSIQLIILDDGSSDKSVETIRRFVAHNPSIQFYDNTTNLGYTRSLNKALRFATGEFIIDLAADDILLPNRVVEGVEALTNAGTKYGVNFSDAILIDEKGATIGHHSNKYPHHTIPQGDIYKAIISRYFICAPTLMYRKTVIDQLGGYDETLAYEDFDFLIRASRDFQFCYTPNALVKRRLVAGSMSHRQFSSGDAQRISTLHVCQKIEKLNRDDSENKALKKRVLYEFFLSLRLRELKLAVDFIKIYFRLSSPKTMLT